MRRGRLPLMLPALLLACGPAAPTEEATPLVDGLHAPLVLTESAFLEMPPSDSPNRFVSGWWPDRRSTSLRQTNAVDRVVLEAVFLDGRERRLATRLRILESEPEATFGVRVAGVELPPRQLVPDLEVPLPGGLPLGRLPIELDLRGARVIVDTASLGHAWRPGEVRLSPAEILQGGYSAVDFPRRLERPATLVGRFEPPPQPDPDQRFAVIVETDEGDGEVAFEWLPDQRRASRPRELRIPLPAGFVRVRLLAQGLGGAARWLAMGIGGGEPSGEAPRLSIGQGRAGPTYIAASDRYKLVKAPDLGLVKTSRDAEYLFDLRRDPSEEHNLAGARLVEAEWLRSRLEAWIERGARP